MSENNTTYRAYCNNHDWEGMAHYDEADAQKDLDAHREQVDGSPSDSGVKRS